MKSNNVQSNKGLASFELGDLYKPDPASDYQPTPEAPTDPEAFNHPQPQKVEMGYNDKVLVPEEPKD